MTIDNIEKQFSKENLQYTVGVLVLTLLGFVIRLRYMFLPILVDEAQSYMAYAIRPLMTGLSIYPEPNNHPLNTLLMHVSTRLFGNNLAAIRLFPFLCGVALIPLTYVLFKKIYNKQVGAIASAVVSTGSITLISFSADGRGYMIQAFLVSLATYFAVTIKRDNKGWVGFAVTSILAFYALPTTIFFFGGLACWLLLSGLYKDTATTGKAFMKKLVFVCVVVLLVVVLLYLPFAINSGLDSLVSNKYVERMPLDQFFGGLYSSGRMVYREWSASLVPMFFILLLGFIISIVFHRKISNDRVNIMVPILGWCVLVVIIQTTVPFARTWLPLLPLFFGVSSAGLFLIGQKVKERIMKTRSLKPKPYLFGLSVIGLGIVLFSAVYPASYNRYENHGEYLRIRHRKIVEELKNTLEEGDILYTGALPIAQFEYYFIRNDIPLEHLYGNISGENMPVDDIRRLLIVTDPSHALLGQALYRSNIEFNDLFLLEKIEDWILNRTVYYGLPDGKGGSP